MTEQEQIKRMANIAEYQLFDLQGDADDVAKALYANGCRINSKNTTVMSKEDFDKKFNQGYEKCKAEMEDLLQSLIKLTDSVNKLADSVRYIIEAQTKKI